MFSDRRHLRRWATRVLLVWLFGIATGIAHACALHLSGVRADQPIVVSHAHGSATDNGSEQANCLDFCEKSSATAPTPSAKVDAGADSQAPAILPGPTAWVVDRPLRTPARRDGSAAPRGGPPPRIAFQRLAL
jgi:hypothetical protein